MKKEEKLQRKRGVRDLRGKEKLRKESTTEKQREREGETLLSTKKIETEGERDKERERNVPLGT